MLVFSVTNANADPNVIVPKAVLILLSELSTIYSTVLLGFSGDSSEITWLVPAAAFFCMKNYFKITTDWMVGSDYCMRNSSTTITVVINVLYRCQIMYFCLCETVNFWISRGHPWFYVLLVPLCYKYGKDLKACSIISCPKTYILDISHLWYSLILIFPLGFHVCIVKSLFDSFLLFF